MDGKETVLKKFDVHSDKFTHWKIYYGYNAIASALVDSTETHSGDLDKDLSRKRLSEALDILQPGDYLIQIKAAPNSTNNIINHRFKIGHEYSTGNQQNQNTPALRGYISPSELQARIDAELSKRDVQDLRKEIEEIKNAKVGGWAEVIEGVKGILPLLAGLRNPQLEPRPTVIRGPQPEAGSEEAQRKQWFLGIRNEAAKGLYNTEDFGEVSEGEYVILLLWCLAEAKRENPEAYKMIAPQILQHYKKLMPDES